MEELINELTSIRFWIAVVFVGIIINLVSSYIKPLVDRSIGAISETYQSRLEARRNDERILFNSLIESAELRSIYRQQAIFERTRSVWFACLGMGFLITAVLIQLIGNESLKKLSIFMLAGGVYGLFLSMKYVSSSTKKWIKSVAAFDANNQRQADA